jgi:hypothetical protein
MVKECARYQTTHQKMKMEAGTVPLMIQCFLLQRDESFEWFLDVSWLLLAITENQVMQFRHAIKETQTPEALTTWVHV